jgi:hypothetical protein
MILAHIIAPHPPFVFGADGEAVQPRPYSTIRDDRVFLTSGRIRAWIPASRQFVVKEMTILWHPPAPWSGPPVVLLFGDRGPASMLDSNDPAKTNLRERMANPPLTRCRDRPCLRIQRFRRLTPAGFWRIAIWVQPFLLPEAAEFATLSHPYQFIPCRAAEPDRLSSTPECTATHHVCSRVRHLHSSNAAPDATFT